jgi:hypothetical protein
MVYYYFSRKKGSSPSAQKEKIIQNAQNAQNYVYYKTRTPDKAKLNYVCCDRCDLWYHEACTNRDEADRAGDDDFECDKCVTE